MHKSRLKFRDNEQSFQWRMKKSSVENYSPTPLTTDEENDKDDAKILIAVMFTGPIQTRGNDVMAAIFQEQVECLCSFSPLIGHYKDDSTAPDKNHPHVDMIGKLCVQLSYASLVAKDGITTPDRQTWLPC